MFCSQCEKTINENFDYYFWSWGDWPYYACSKKHADSAYRGTQLWAINGQLVFMQETHGVTQIQGKLWKFLRKLIRKAFK